MQRSVLDRLIGVFSPSAELQRLRARAALEMEARAYDAAGVGRRASGWRAPSSSGRAESEAALRTLRARCRDLARNNPLAASLSRQFAGRVVGTGITLRPKHRVKLVQQRANDAWKRFTENCDPEGLHDWNGIADLAVRSMFEGGETLLRWDMDARGGMTVQLLEGDHLDETKDTKLFGGRNETDYRAGIEFSGQRRAAYWLFPEHPGDSARPQLTSQRVEARYIDHLFERMRPGQMRGLPWLTPAALRLKNFDQIHEAIEMRKRLEACIGIAIETMESGAAPALGVQKKDDAGKTLETMSPGMVVRTGPGEKIQTINPASSGDVVEYMRGHLHAFCAMVGVPYHAATGDVSQANYSSQRAAILAGNILIDQTQWLTVVPRIMTPAARRVMQAEALRVGDPRLLDVECEWSTPVRPWVDPVKEVMAKVIEIRAGLQSMPDALAERGLEWTSHLVEVADFLKAVDEQQLTFDTDGRQVTKTGAAANVAAMADAAGKQIAADAASDPKGSAP